MRSILKNTALCCALLGASHVAAQNIFPNECYNGTLTDFQTSWIANSGGTPRTHVPHSMDALFVRADGTVATICNWDEGGTNVGVWRDGKIISIPEQSGTGSWGRNSGKAVAMDDQYVYQLMRFNGNSGNDSKNANGLWSYPPKGSGIEYQLITRYEVETGKAARFPLGYGPLCNMLFVCPQQDRYLQGLAITDDKLIVSVPGMPELEIPDSLKIYDKATMSSEPVGGFRITEGGVGYLAADKRGFVWMLQRGKSRIVAIDLRNGAIRQQSIINLPAGTDARSFSIDTNESGEERILVANSGKDLNVLIYTNIYAAPTLSGTFGVKGGVLGKSPKPEGGEYVQGEMGHLRFPGPTGAGVDAQGNIYVSTMFVNSATAILYSHKEKEQTLNWKQEGLVFTSTADFDQTQKNKVFCIEKVYELDYSKEGKRMDELIATTVDPFSFPDDFRLEPNPPTPIKTGVFKRLIEGKDYLFVTNMYSTMLGGYRFDPENHGYIGIPCMEIRADKLSFWVDSNGDGQKDANEVITYPSAGATFSIYPDHDGNIWLADRNTQSLGYSSFRFWKRTGIDANGVLQYAAPVTYRLPAYIKDVNRVLYDVERDEMLVACYTEANPTPNTALWGQVGTTILTYKNMTERFANIQTTPSENWQHDQELVIPASPRTTQGSATDPGVEISAKAMTYAGDYIFTFLCANGTVNIYERGGENIYVGQLSPGDEVERKSGWTDFTYAINARKNEDGTYEILGEENAFAKIVHYTLRSFKGDFNMKGDLIPEFIHVKNGANERIDSKDIPEGQPVKFTVRVKNSGVGVVKNKRRTDPTRCLVKFTVTDTRTNQVVYEAYSNAHEEDIYSGEYVDMSVENSEKVPFWIYSKGVYKVDVDVNAGSKGDECVEENNYKELTFGGGDNTGDITGPLVPPVIPDGIDEVLSTGINIYPNPATTTLTIYTDTADENLNITITTVDGRTVLSKPVKNNVPVDVSGLLQGYYLLQVNTPNGSKTQGVIIR